MSILIVRNVRGESLLLVGWFVGSISMSMYAKRRVLKVALDFCCVVLGVDLGLRGKACLVIG